MTPKKTTNKSTSKSSSSASASSTASTASSGFKVQIIYLAARNKVPKAPIKDALWFATYPIIPRIGDCIFRDGVYYRVERVCLYENVAPGWCADVEVSYYGR